MDQIPILKTNVFDPEHHLKAWYVRNVSTMAKEGVQVWAICDTCNRDVEVDVTALAAKVPWEYSLINRRCPCRITHQCDGWNVFWHKAGFCRDGETFYIRLPLFDRKTYQRWFGTRCTGFDT